MCITFSPALQGGEQVGRGEGRVGEGGEGKGKPSQMKTPGPKLPTDGPDHAT